MKALLKFRCVCKDWRSLIDSPNFASLHLNAHKNNRQNDRVFVIDSDYFFRDCSIRHSATFRKNCEFFLYVGSDSRIVRVEGYVNGLILFSKIHDGRISGFIVRNPSIGKSMEIPPPDHYCLDDPSKVLVRFVCIDGVGNGYKVVVMPVQNPRCLQEKLPPSDDQSNPSYALFEIYSLNSGSWRSCSIFTHCRWSFTVIERTPFLNGAIHWIGCDMSMASSHLEGSHVVAFDVQNEALNHFSLPDDLGIYRSRTFAVLGQSLALWDMELGSSAIWVMEQYGVAESWVRRYTISFEFGRILYFRSNGELLVNMEKQKLKTYNINSQEVKDVARSYKNRIIFMDMFVESLVLPRSGKELKKS